MSGFDGEKSYACEYCDRRFVYGDSLQRHLAICPTRLRAIIQTLINCPHHRHLKLAQCRGVALGEAVLKEDSKGR